VVKNGPMQPSSFNTHGAVDLAALAAQRAARERAEVARAEAARIAEEGGEVPVPSAVIEATEANFQTEIMDRSMTTPVVVDFWAEWCEPCKQLSPLLEKLAAEAAGAWVLATIDVDANPRLGQAFQVQSIPTVFVVWQGQLVPGFQGALPEADLRGFLTQVGKLAGEFPSGAVGAGPDGTTEQVITQPLDPMEEAALDALDAGDLAGAAQAFRNLVDVQPGNQEAKVGLARVELLMRTRDVDPVAVRAAAAERPDDVQAQCLAADVDVAAGFVEDAVARLVDTVRATAGADRATARDHLVAIFAVLGDEDSRVIQGRTALANALF